MTRDCILGYPLDNLFEWAKPKVPLPVAPMYSKSVVLVHLAHPFPSFVFHERILLPPRVLQTAKYILPPLWEKKIQTVRLGEGKKMTKKSFKLTFDSNIRYGSGS